MTLPDTLSEPLDQARWIARQLLHVVRDEIGPDRSATIVNQLDHITGGTCSNWLAPAPDPCGEDGIVTFFEAARVCGVKPRTVKWWTEQYPRVVPRIEGGVRLVDCRRYQAMTTEERRAA